MKTLLISPRPHELLVLTLAVLMLSGCSMQRLVGNRIADTLAGDGGAFARDPDIEFLGEAVPFALKLMESSAEAAPRHVEIRQALAAGFTQYAAVYVDWPAEQQRFSDFSAYAEGQQRARAFYGRAAGWASAALELAHPGWDEALQKQPEAMLARTGKADVPSLYWLAAAWLLPLGSSLEEPELLGRVPLARALLQRCEALDPDWHEGAINEALIGVEATLPGAAAIALAERRFERATAGTGRAAPYLALAFGVALPGQDRARFSALLEQALAVPPGAEPGAALANLHAQRRARFYLAHLNELFI